MIIEEKTKGGVRCPHGFKSGIREKLRKAEKWFSLGYNELEV